MTHRFVENRKRGVRDQRFSAMSSTYIDEMGYLAEWRAAFELGLWGSDAKIIDAKRDQGYDLLLRGRRLEVKWVSYDELAEVVMTAPRPTADIMVLVFGKTPETLYIRGWLTSAEVRAFPFVTHRSGKKLPKGGHLVPTGELRDMRSLRRLS